MPKVTFVVRVDNKGMLVGFGILMRKEMLFTFKNLKCYENKTSWKKRIERRENGF